MSQSLFSCVFKTFNSWWLLIRFTRSIRVWNQFIQWIALVFILLLSESHRLHRRTYIIIGLNSILTRHLLNICLDDFVHTCYGSLQWNLLLVFIIIMIIIIIIIIIVVAVVIGIVIVIIAVIIIIVIIIIIIDIYFRIASTCKYVCANWLHKWLKCLRVLSPNATFLSCAFRNMLHVSLYIDVKRTLLNHTDDNTMKFLHSKLHDQLLICTDMPNEFLKWNHQIW